MNGDGMHRKKAQKASKQGHHGVSLDGSFVLFAVCSRVIGGHQGWQVENGSTKGIVSPVFVLIHHLPDNRCVVHGRWDYQHKRPNHVEHL